MELVNQLIARLGELYGAMSPGARLFAALSAAIVVGCAVWMVGQNVAPGDSYLMGGESFSLTQLRNMESALGQAGLTDYQIDGTRMSVPQGEQAKYMAALAEAGALPTDFGEYLRKAVDTNGFMLYGSRQEAQLKVAVQSELQGLINNFQGIERSFVQIAEETSQGFPRVKTVTASVGVQPSTSNALDERTVSAIRWIVASAWGGLKPESVTVVDLSTKRLFAGPLTTDTPGSGEFIETKKRLELDWQNKIARVLGIPGAVITSNVELEPDGHSPHRVSVSVAVPQAYLASLWQQQFGSAGPRQARPDQAAFSQFEAQEWQRIKLAVAPLLEAGDSAIDRTSLVAVSTIYTLPAPMQAVPRPEDVLLSWLIKNWQNVGLGVLVVIALLLMRSMFTSNKQSAKSALDEIVESISHAHDERPITPSLANAEAAEQQAAPQISSGQIHAPHAAVPAPHAPASVWQAELADRVRQDPQAAASVLKNWLGNES